MPAASSPRQASPLLVRTPASPPSQPRHAAASHKGEPVPPERALHSSSRPWAESRSRSPSPSRAASPSPAVPEDTADALAPPQASPALHEHARDEVEVLAEPAGARSSDAGDSRPRAPSVVFAEPEQPQRPSYSKGRDRKSSFLGLSFGGGGGSSGSQDGGDGRRRLSFGSKGGGGPAEPVESPQGAADPNASRKSSSGPRALLRRAKSFGTSPVLDSAKDGVFPSPTASSGRSIGSPNVALPPPIPPASPSLASAGLGLPRLSTSSIALDSSPGSSSPLHAYHGESPRPFSTSASGTSSPFTPHSPYLSHGYSSRASSSIGLDRPSPAASASTMVLPDSAGSPHFEQRGLTPPLPASQRFSSDAERTSAESTGSSGRRRSADDRDGSARRRGGKGKERERDERAGSVPLAQSAAAPTLKKKTRRATLGGLFGRKGDKVAAAAAAAAEEERRAAGGDMFSSSMDGARGTVYGSPADSPALSSSAVERDESAFAASTLPSLPSLPSLHLSQNPYRMSWAFGSPSNSPEKPAAVSSTRSSSPATSTRPSLSITTTPVNSSPVPASPIDDKLLSASPHSGTPTRPPLSSAQTLPLPPPLETTKSTDSTATLLIRNPAVPADEPDSLSSSTATVTPGHALTRGGLSASSPPSLRRANSYAPTSSSPRHYTSTAPFTRSPLSSPSKELSNPMSASASPSSSGPPAAFSPRAQSASNSAQSSPSLARVVQTRAARSQSDASDRRSPASPPLYSPRNMVVGGFGLPPGGGVFAGAGKKVGERPATTEGSSGTGARSSGGSGGGGVFGSLGSFFGGGASSASLVGSQSMSRSTSAATSSTGAGSTPAPSPGLTAGGVETSEFGALFDGGGSSERRATSLARPGSGRTRGLSVGAGIGSFFGGGSSSSNNSASLGAGAVHSPTKLAHQTRARSGSGSSTGTLGSAGLAPPSGTLDTLAGSSAGGRVRALTDPTRRFSLASFGSGSAGASLALPGGHSSGGGARPGTADGVIPRNGGGNRSRGNSVTSGSPAPPPKRARKAPKPRIDEGETPEQYVVRLLEGEAPRRVSTSASRRPSVSVREEGEARNGSSAGEGDAERLVEPACDAEDIEIEGSERLPKSEVTRVLASSSDPFYLSALQAFLRLFPFHDLALDIALRVFLCSASLPTETQQIDRVMEAFARRYCECNPDIFGAPPKKRDAGDEGLSGEGAPSEETARTGGKKDGKEDSDIPYVLAFSMVMLNTDHFNPNAKSKMTKADYVKNTRIDGVAPEVLEYLYDQITAAPFIYVDDEDPATSLFSPAASTTSLLGGSLGPSGSAASFASSTVGGSAFLTAGHAKSRLDPYHLIATNQTQRFKVDVESHIPSKSPFSFTGTIAFFDATRLHTLFARAPVLQFSNRPRASSKPTPVQVSAVAPYSPSPNPDDPSSAANAALAGSPLFPTVSNGTFIADAPKKKDRSPISTLKITKVGLLSRKEDLAEGGKKAASRKWRGWSVVLTGSQLLFFKDPHFASSLLHALQAAAAASEPKPDDGQVLVFTWQSSFKPDAVLSLANSAAIYDSSYSKYRNVFRLVAPAGRQYLFQAHNAEELNSWLHAINFAAAFKTAGVRIRPLQPASPGLSTSQRTVPVTPPSPALTQRPSKARSNGESEPTSRLVRSTAVGSLADTVGLAASNVSGVADVISPGLRQALEANGANGVDSTNGANGQSGTVRASDDDDVPLARLPALKSTDLPASPALAPAPPPVTARADLLRRKIQELGSQIRQAKETLQADLRLAKHLAILTPFRHTTRERVLTAIPPIEKRVRHARINLAKLVCYREVLSRDLLVEDRESERLIRKQSLHRAHSRRTSSIPRQRSPPPHLASRNATIKASSRSAALSQSTTSLHPHAAMQSDGEHLGRSSFDSMSDSFAALASDAQPQSLTDDELDRLQVRSPPPLMQRSKTETDWQSVVEHLAEPLQGGSGSSATTGLGLGGARALHSEDELEVRAHAIDAPARRESVASPMSPASTDGGFDASPGGVASSAAASRSGSFSLSTTLAPPILESRRSH